MALRGEAKRAWDRTYRRARRADWVTRETEQLRQTARRTARRINSRKGLLA